MKESIAAAKYRRQSGMSSVQCDAHLATSFLSGSLSYCERGTVVKGRSGPGGGW